MRRLWFASLLAFAACKGSSDAPAPTTPPASAHPPIGPLKVLRAKPITAVDAAAAAAAPAKGALPLSIVAVHAHEQPTATAPWLAAGGDWTYLDLKTPGGATFTVGFHDAGTSDSMPPIKLLDVRVVELDRAQGAALVQELQQALGVTVSSAAVTAKELTPLTVAAQIDDKNPHGGDWTASTWYFAGGPTTTIHFDWSISANQAVLREADPAVDGAAVAALGAALRDGLGAQP